MSAAFTKDELRRMYGYNARLMPPGGRQLNAEELVEINALQEKLAAMIASSAGASERGAKVLEWRIPNLQAPTMNQYAFMKGWQRTNLRKELDDQLLKIIEKTSGAKVHGEKTQRWVRVTRFTLQPKNVDDAAVDAIGGKMPIDSLVRCGVLVNDTPALCRREAVVRKTDRGNTHVLVEVFAVSAEEVPDPGPQDAKVEQPPRKKKKRGKIAQAIAEGGTT